MEISEKKFEELCTAQAYLTIVVALHERGKVYVTSDVLDVVAAHMYSGDDTHQTIKLGNGEAELC